MPDNGGKSVLLAIAIILLWLAGLGFFIAFEGTKLLGGKMPKTKTATDSLIEGLSREVADAARDNT